MGTFHYNPLFHGDEVVFIAGGSGVVPAMSMIRDIVDSGSDRRFRLIYGSRDAGDVIFAEELAQVAAAHPNITVEVVLDSVDHLGDHRPAGRSHGLHLRPAADVPVRAGAIAGVGSPAPSGAVRGQRPARGSERAGVVAFRSCAGSVVTVNVGSRSFETTAGRPLLDALEDNGFTPEVGCRSGECSLCRVRVVSGEVHSADEAKPRMSDRGRWVCPQLRGLSDVGRHAGVVRVHASGRA